MGNDGNDRRRKNKISWSWSIFHDMKCEESFTDVARDRKNNGDLFSRT